MPNQRKIKLILPSLQIRLIGAFLGLAALGLLAQYLLLLAALSWEAHQLPNDGAVLLDRLEPLLLRVSAISACLILPLTFFVGVLATHAYAGPIHRLKGFLRDVIDGKRPADCQLRKGDQLLDVCDLINQATAPVREQRAPTAMAKDDRLEKRAAG